NRLGLKTPYRTAEDVMGEIVRVTPSWRGVTYERLEGAGLQYPVPTPHSPGTAFLFDVRFPTADGKAIFVPVEYAPPVELPAAANLLTNPVLDPYAKMAELKCCAVRVAAVEAPATVA